MCLLYLNSCIWMTPNQAMNTIKTRNYAVEKQDSIATAGVEEVCHTFSSRLQFFRERKA